MQIQIFTAQHGSIVVAQLQGELDDHTSDAVRTALDQALDTHQAVRLVIDLSELTFMDSSGLGVILGRFRKLKKKGGLMAVSGVSKSVKRLFEISGVHKIMSIYETCDDAIHAFKEVSR